MTDKSGKDDKFETRVVSKGRMSDAHFGAVNTPIYRASTILYPDLAAVKANTQPYTYGRRGTPTTRSFEDAISELEGADKTVTVTSGHLGAWQHLDQRVALDAGDEVLGHRGADVLAAYDHEDLRGVAAEEHAAVALADHQQHRHLQQVIFLPDRLVEHHLVHQRR